jgi:hypothetical protein
MSTATAPGLTDEEFETAQRFEMLPDAIALDEGHDFIQAGQLQILDRFELQPDGWKRPVVFECWTYPHWGIVHGQVEFTVRRVLKDGKTSHEPPVGVSLPFVLWLKVVAK